MLSLTQLLTNTHVIAAAVICLLAVLLTFLLTRNFRNRLTFVLGTAWWLICLGVFAVGGVYLFQTQSTLRTIAGIQTEASNISAYVLTDDPAQTLTDASGYSFGILSTLDRENTDTVVSRINEQLGTTIQTAEYAGLTQLADGLRNGEVGAVILNDAYLDLYEEFDGYTDFPTSVRALTTEVVETTIVDPADQAQASAAPSLDENPVLNIYISGSDTRSSTLPSRSRSDVNILASINTQTRQVLLISTPRDYYVPLSISNGAPDKLTHAGIYGVQVSMDTLSMLYEVPVDYYFRVNFNGFVDI
ncbi:MAG: LCP family protein, partial [Lachnospiraceae bacterium]|nr:LCP family protein [Lachnospiraceae bacterium]